MTFLALETSTRNCSVAVFKGEELISLVEADSDQYIHSEKLHLFIKEALLKAQIDVSELNAVAVGAGPGSYTGLRIGVASAKALAYALNIPLYSAKGTELLVAGALELFNFPSEAILQPMIDARRMEVYTASFQMESQTWTQVEAKIIEAESFSEKDRPVYFFGDGAEKCKSTLKAPHHHYLDLTYPSARFFGKLMTSKINAGEQEDIAYFEPFYLKSFQAIKPKSLL